MASSPLPTLAQLPTILGGDGRGTLSGTRPSSVCIDSRTCAPESLFFALPGERSDGHYFVQQAAVAGAAAAVVRAFTAPDGADWPLPVIVVSDALEALHRLASWYRAEHLSAVRRIGITGSNGKTTCKEMTATVLSRHFRVHASAGNLNSETGLPLSVLATPAGVDIAVYEMAMSNPGEMAPLAEIVRPDIAAITTIGTAHIGQLGSRQAIAAEKKDIAAAFSGTQTLIVPEDDDFREFLAAGVRGTVVDFGPLCQEAQLSGTPGGVQVSCAHGRATVPLPGVHNGRNALLALRIGELCGVPQHEALAALPEVRIPDGRGQQLRVRDVTIINDAYNANPGSMLAAIAAVAEARSLVLVLGDMHELGAYERESHTELATAAMGSGARLVCLVGPRFRDAVASIADASEGNAGRLHLAEDSAAAARILQQQLRPGDTVLLKASRAVALEKVIPVITAGEGARA